MLDILIKESGRIIQVPLKGQLAASVADYLVDDGLKYFPNPIKKTINIEYLLKTNALVSINIYDVRGNLQKSFADINGREGMNSIVWDTRNADNDYCPEGNYYMIISISGNRMSVPLVISR